MSLRTRSMVLPIAIVAAAMLLSLVGTSAVASASDTVDKDVPQTTVPAAALRDTLPPPDATEWPLLALQPMDDGGGDFNIWWIVGPMMMFIFWAGIIAVIVWGVRQFTGAREQGGSPLDIAKERLARGEISKDEFDRIRGDLA